MRCMLAEVGPAVELSTPAVVMSGILGLVLGTFLYEAAQAVTMAHEGAHAIFAVLAGGKLRGIRLHPGGGGVTHFEGVGWLGRILASFVGYVGPTLFGLLGAALVRTGQPASVLWATLVLLVLLLFTMNNLNGFVKVLLFGGLVAAICRYGSSDVQVFAALTWVWWLLIGAVVGVLKLASIVQSGQGSTDAHNLRALTWIPATVWVLVFLTGTVAGLLTGAGILLGLSSG